MVTTEDMDDGLPVSRQLPLKAAWKNGEAKYSTSLCALPGDPRLSATCAEPTDLDSPERCTFHDDFDGSQERSTVSECFVDLDGLI